MNLQEIAALPLRYNNPAELSRAVRFFCYVTFDESSGCWLWQGGQSDGYGSFATGGAHTFAYKCLRGPIPQDTTLDHLCRIRTCVNPDHLEVVSRPENSRRMHGYYNRWGTPEACPNEHPRTIENTIVRKDGSKKCRQCEIERNRRRNKTEARKAYQRERNRRRRLQHPDYHRQYRLKNILQKENPLPSE